MYSNDKHPSLKCNESLDVFRSINDIMNALHAKRCPMQFADSTGPVQPAHSHRMIKAFVARLHNQLILQNILPNREYVI